MSRRSALALIVFLAAGSALGHNFATTNMQVANASTARFSTAVPQLVVKWTFQ